MFTQGENNKLMQDFGLTINRRRFMKGVAISAPIIATVSSRPVWANTASAVSGNLSGNLSQATTTTVDPYPGYSPGYWQGGNPKGGRIDSVMVVSSSTLFNTVFFQTTTASLKGYSTSYSKTFLEAVQDGGDTNQPERFAAAAYLNALTDPNYPYKPEEIVDFYGYYSRGEISYDDIHSTFVKLTH